MSWTIGTRTYTYRKKITIGSSGKGLNAAVTDSTIVVHADNSADWSTGGGNNFWQHVDNVSGAVAFSADASTNLSFGVESWDYTNKDAWWHVKIGTINTTDTDIYIYYKDEGTAADNSDEVNSFKSGYKFVHHLNADKTGGWTDDAVANADLSSTVGTTDAAGKIDRGRDFDGIDDTADISAQVWGVANGYALECWINMPANSTIMHLINGDYQTGGNKRLWQFRVDSTGEIRFIRFDSSESVIDNYASTGTVDDSTDHHIMAVFDSNFGTRIFIDGSVDGTSATTTANQNTSVILTICYRLANGQRYDGILDEATLYVDSGHTANWWADFNQVRYQSGLGTWLTIGAEETSGATVHTVDVTDGMLMEDPNQRDQSHLLFDNLLLSDSATTQLAQVINLVSQVDGLLIDDSFRFELQKLLLDPALIGDDRSSIIEKILADSLFVSDSVTAQKISGLVTVLVTDGLFLSDNLTMIREMVNLTNVFLSDFAIKHRELSLRDYLLLSETQDIAKTTGRIVTQLVTDGLLLADETIRDMPLTAIDSVLLSTSRQSLRELLDYTNLLLSDSATALKGAEVVITDLIYLRDDRLSEQTKQVLEHVILASLMVKILEALKVDTSLLVRDSTTIATIQAFAQALVYAKTRATDIIGAKLKAVDIMGIKYGVVQ